MKFRWEHIDDCWPQRRWRLLIEGVAETTEVQSLREAFDLLGSTHPAQASVALFMQSATGRLAIVPWIPFVPSVDLIASYGRGIVESVQAMPHDCTVWSDTCGWTWAHIPGDAAL